MIFHRTEITLSGERINEFSMDVSKTKCCSSLCCKFEGRELTRQTLSVAGDPDLHADSLPRLRLSLPHRLRPLYLLLQEGRF